MMFNKSEARLPEELLPGQWMPWKWGATKPYPLTAVICCPMCGKSGTLHPNIHTISVTGIVSPSMVCPYPPCSFHEFIRLDGWS